MPVHMELSRIIISEINDQQIIYLKEVEGERTFPILIGLFEATSIDRRVKHYQSPRPLTHDLLVSMVENLGAELQDVVISELKDHTYYAKLRCAMPASWWKSTLGRPTRSRWRSLATRNCRSTYRKKCSTTCSAKRSRAAVVQQRLPWSAGNPVISRRSPRYCRPLSRADVRAARRTRPGCRRSRSTSRATRRDRR